MSRAGLAYSAFAFVLVLACQKNNLSTSELNASISSNDTLISDSLINDSLTIDTLSYGDSIFSASVVGNEKKVFPVIRPSKPGYFAASLPGLDLDSLTGRINISRSESGLRYKVYYLSPAKELIASTSVLIAGIDYQDHIYDVSSDAPDEQLAVPIYNMTPGAPLPCINGSGGQGCKFDETDLNSDTIPDVIGARNSKLVIDTASGVIDLKKSLDAGIFGAPPLGNPAALNGRKKDVTIYYNLQEGTTRTLKKITVRLVYYQSKALIPESMQLEIDSRNQRYLLEPGSASTSGSSGGDLLSLAYYYYSKPKRPPLIVIVSGK